MGKRRSRKTRLLKFVKRLTLAFLAASVLLVLSFRWIPPPTTSAMMGRCLSDLFSGKGLPDIRYHWVGWESISPHMRLAVVAAEDQKFPEHWGFDFGSIADAVQENGRKGRLRGASTITQQVSKNLFLWSGRSWFRKGLEAHFTVLLEIFWPKRRILEVYLNVAQFSDTAYGVDAAAHSLFGKDPSKLTRRESALLAAVLPNPRRLRAKNPSSYVDQRARWVERQMRHLGGTAYLSDI